MALDGTTLVEQAQQLGYDLALFAVAVAIVYLLGRFLIVPTAVRVVQVRNPNNPTLVDAVKLYLEVLFLSAGIPIGITIAGFGNLLSGSALVVAAVTLAVGVAGQAVISNLVSGVFLVMDANFNVGDYIEWNNNGGRVVKIGLRTTRVRTPDNEIVTVPNDDLSTMEVRHPFDGTRYRASQRLSVAYDEDIDSVSAMLRETAIDDERVLAKPEPEVTVEELGDSAVRLVVQFWIHDPAETDIVDTRSSFAVRAKDRLVDAGVAVAPASPQDISGELTIKNEDP